MMALAAKAFSEEQMQFVANADIDDGVGFVELERTLAELPPRQVTHMIENLEANPSWLSTGRSTLERFLGFVLLMATTSPLGATRRVEMLLAEHRAGLGTG